jgi:hypothetical protein
MHRIFTLLLVGVLFLAAVTGAQPALAQSGNQWQVYYYNNPNWAGAPVYTTYTNLVNFNWGSDTPPAPNMPAQNWTARFISQAYFYAGIYRFQLQADDEIALYIDNALYADTRGANQPGKALTIDIPLQQGNHNLDIEYRQYTAAAYISVNWFYLKDTNTGQPVPPPPPPPQNQPSGGAPQLFPPPTNLVTDFGNYTSCAQQQIHQQNCFVSNGAWNAPNMGSVSSEPQILRWMNCTQDQVQTIQLYTNQPPQSAKCSKTEAGWFPN